nr:zinc finger, CCHC-type [Tanacetum cinerariifolium]
MEDANPICTLGDYSKPSHEGYMNTIELPVRNNVVPLRSDTIRLVQNGCSFHGLRSKDQNQHLNDFLKLVDSLDHDGENRERTRLRLFQFSLRDQASNWLEQRTAKLCNDIMMFQQHQGESLPEAWTRFKDLLQKYLIMASIFGSKSKSFMTMSLPPQDKPLTNRPVEEEAKEEGNVKTSTIEYENHEMTVESKEEFEEETKDEIEEEYANSPKHFDTFPTMKELRLHYNRIMSKRLGPRRKPSNPGKIYKFMGRVKGLKIFVGKFTYKCDFMLLKDTTIVIDHDLGSFIFGKPFVEATGLIYDREEGTITFKKDNEKIVFKMPHKMEMFKHIDFTDIKTDRIPPFAIESDDDSNKTHYSDSLNLGPAYKHDKNVRRAIRSLIATKDKRKKEKSRKDV